MDIFWKNGHIGDSKSAKIRNVKFAFGREDGKVEEPKGRYMRLGEASNGKIR